ncbi:MAG: FtsX-like permease family protein [Kofleriaceae bacterium]|nr:FtsX-like permease family protein [Kofleriaceae bacterium]MBP9167000.1 FtsX-like permease family protein [Kofleriaceae bacterium]MBP9858311.1 FtsX-like permease family protein [Kofleriaceae bacterium]
MTTDVAARVAAARGGRLRRVRVTLRVALRMMLHDKSKLVGTTLGVVFAVVLAAQQLGVLFGLLQKNTMFVDNAGADLWLVPPGTTQASPGQRMSTALLDQARATPGVASASALIMVGTSVSKPGGGSEAITLVGFELATALGGPWNVVAGDVAALAGPDAVFFEDAQRENFGGLNLGSVREVGGQQVRAVGFTWGLQPFGPPYAFADLDLARELGDVPTDELSFVLIKLAPGVDRAAVAADLARRCPTATVLTADGFHDAIVNALLREQLGITFGTSTAFGLIIGFIIVALSMFSAVIDNLREFGTLKAIGLTSWDLALMLLVQSLVYALIGSLIGLGLVGLMSAGIRSANLVVIVPTPLIIATPIIMSGLCMLASVLAMRRVRRLEPGMVFR